VDSLVEVSATTAEVRRVLVTLAAAEASGVARWCLDTAVAHAGVREQFGRRIGAFQAVKHLCAEMLETSESVTAAAWDAARAATEDEQQQELAAHVAATVCFDGAVEVAKSCIQVLGGIGFTFEHDAHLHLRRALALRSAVGPSGRAAAALATLASRGVRRSPTIELDEGAGDREGVRAEVERIGRLPKVERRNALVDTGLLAPHWPKPHGRGAGPVEQLVIDEELERAGVERPDLKIGAWAAPTILAHGSDEQRERFVRPTLTGEITWCQLFSEPEAGSDLASLRTKATRADDGWRLTGQKVWTSMAHEADWGICLARTDPDAPQHRGITYFLVDMRSPGIEIRPLRELTGEEMFNEVFLDDVLVHHDCVVGEVNGGWRLARTTLANERVAMAGSRLGDSVERAVELAQDETERVRAGHAVASATVVKLLGTRATLRALAGQGPGPESSVAKLVGVRSRQDSAELVVELLGDRVFSGDELARAAMHELLLTRCLSIAGGTTQVLRNVAAERILGLPRG
jgi:alkylation response protein AidB-like acyl-CoA dehydrogenase